MIVFDNPEFVRLCRIKLRPRTMIVLGVASLSIFGAILALMQYSMGAPVDTYRTFFFTVVGIQIGFGSLYALMLSSQNITLERERNTYDFQRLVAMGPWRLGIGKLFGSAIEAIFAISGGSLFSFIPVMLGHMPPWAWLEAQIVVLVFVLLTVSFGLMCSSMVAKTSYASGIMILFVMFVLPGAIGSMSVSGSTIWAAANPALVLYEIFRQTTTRGYAVPAVTLFGADWIPIPLAFLAMNFAFTLLCFVITVRRLTDEELSIIKPKHAAIAFGILEFLIIGSSWESYSSTSASMKSAALAAFHIANATTLMLLAFGLTPSAELLRGRVSRGRRNDHWKIFFERHNRLDDAPGVSAVISFGAVYAILAFLLTWKLNIGGIPALAIVPMVFAMGVATASLLLYINVYTEKGGLKLGALIIILSLVIPPMIAGSLLSPEKIFAINPFAYMGAFAADAELHGAARALHGEISQIACPLLCAALAIAFSALAAMRVRFLLDIDDLQRQREQEHANKPSDKAVAAARAMLTAKPETPPELPSEVEAESK